MAGAWCCADCAAREGVRGHGYAERGYCGVGGHVVATPLVWVPGATHIDPLPRFGKAYVEIEHALWG